MAIQHYQQLIVWQKAMDMVVDVYSATKGFPSDERFGLTSQLRRAAISIPSNVAEGQCRGTPKEFCQFLRFARGSLGEGETQIIAARRLGFLKEKSEASLLEQASEVGRLLNGLLRSLKQE